MAMPNSRHPDCLMPFMNERLASCLGHLSALLNDWRKWPPGISETDGRYSPSECAFRRIIGHKVMEQLQAATEAASACTVKAAATEATT
jgi:hypothetical protein